MPVPTNPDAQNYRNKLREMLPQLKDQYNVKYIGLFGSYIRGEQTPESDLDILVAFSKTPSLLQFIDLENYLSDNLGIKVDLVMKDSLKPNIGKHILNEVRPV
ncbi:DNA polymerase III subunit beta [Methanohalophilus sp. RSK]|uniref:nucleotidyltransferase family protein n=1 Tax=Methanohalophilus sp. RSK TaxID=2485783 RepID=UPI000F43DA8E|nr:nucleotidyltransferase family protein [Methanohalophilus sp. RSK]RNI15748.1 DNA polymerase III subunit beta [Methanohalophilus sp. RSK]